MKKLIIIAAVLIASGCATTEPVKPSVFIQNTYLIPNLGADVTDIPKNIPMPNLQTATQADIAKWIIDNENRIIDLEAKIGMAKNITGVMIKKNSLKPGDYKVIDLTKKDLAEAK